MGVKLLVGSAHCMTMANSMEHTGVLRTHSICFLICKTVKSFLAATGMGAAVTLYTVIVCQSGLGSLQTGQVGGAAAVSALDWNQCDRQAGWKRCRLWHAGKTSSQSPNTVWQIGHTSSLGMLLLLLFAVWHHWGGFIFIPKAIGSHHFGGIIIIIIIIFSFPFFFTEPEPQQQRLPACIADTCFAAISAGIPGERCGCIVF